MTASGNRPFQRGKFEELPEKPRIPHPYFNIAARTVQVASRDFGSIGIHVRTHGSGPPLLLVHGLMTTGYSWRYVIDGLAQKFTLYIPDLPGAGRSDMAVATPFHPDSLARFITDLQRALGIYGCDVIANSMGGYLCMKAALFDPTSMKRLINVHSPGVPEARLYLMHAAMALPGSRALFRWLVQRNPLRWAHKNVHYYDESLKSLEEAHEYGDPLGTPDGLIGFRKYLSDTFEIAPMRAFHRELAERKKSQKPFPIPLLLLYAKDDPLVPARFGPIFAEAIPSAKFEWLTEASHFAHVDAPERFLEPTLKFLS